MHHSAVPHSSPSLFQPPTSPASTIATPSNDYFSRHSRKRQRPTSSYSQHDLRLQTPGAWREEQNQHQQPRETLTPSWVQCPTPTDNMYDTHNSALVNERYTLQGGFDTPGLMASGAEDRFSKDGDMEFRRRVRDPDYIDRGSAGHAMISGPLARERNGVARMPSSPNGNQGQNQPGWASFAFSLVGKVFNFGSSVIQGFYAGGGKGYDLQQQQHLSDSRTQPQQRGSQTPVPGSWQDDDDATSPTTQPARPPNKRRHTDKDAWVLVGTPDHTDLSPKRKASSTSIPRTNPAMMRPRPSSRRSLAPVSRRTSSYNGSPAQHPDSSHTRRASIAPTRSPNHPSPHARPSSSHRPRPSLTHSPRPSLDGRPSSGVAGLSPEADRYIKRQARQEKAADKAIGSMNRQLKDLITQAREALGTRVDVDVDVDMDMEMEGGFVDE